MSKRAISKPHKSLLAQALIAAFATLSAGSALAVPNTLIPPGDASDFSSWSAGATATDAANIINMEGIWNATDGNEDVELGYGLYIGHQTNGKLDITVDGSAYSTEIYIDIDGIDPAMPTLTPYWDPSFRVGDAGGNGTLNINLLALPEQDGEEWRMYIDEVALGVGLGEGSTGLVNIIGTGKDSNAGTFEAPNLVYFESTRQNFLIGQGKGNGTLNLDGAELTVNLGQYYDNDLPLNYFAVGDGAGANGQVTVLGSSKMAIGNPFELGNVSERADELPLSFIGKDGGNGLMTIAPSTNGIQNQANFVLGLAVGHSSGNGTLEVLQGGKSFISNGGNSDLRYDGVCHAMDTGEYPIAPAPLLISADGTSSTGLVRTAGLGSELLVAGKSNDNTDRDDPFFIKEESIGEIIIGTGGSLVASDNGLVKVGVSRLLVQEDGEGEEQYSRSTVGGLGPITVSGSGEVIYGSETTNPSRSGTIDAALINLDSAAARLVFNHTAFLNFNLPLAGNGLLTQQAGTTTVSATLAGLPELGPLFAFDMEPPCTPAIATDYPLNQAAFTGGIDVQGGTLVLPATDVLPSLTSTTISAGTLLMSSTNQSLGTVTLAGGILQLSGTSVVPNATTAKAIGGLATDIATASTWAGSGNGTVSLDTVLGADGSPSDQLRITEAITGTTLLKISNLGGTGAQTSGEGILVVQANQPNAANSFVLAAPVVQGGYRYTLQQTGNNWYLVSSPYVAPPSQATPVPSMSMLGLLGLGGLLAAFSSRSIRKGRKASKV